MDSSDEETDPLHRVLLKMEAKQITASDVVLALLKEPDLQEHPLSQDLVSRTEEVLSAFRSNPHSSRSTMDWANSVVKAKYAGSIRAMTDVRNGWHFGAATASAKQLRDFRIEEMAEKMQEMAPELWDMLGLMLSADARQTKKRTQSQAASRDADGDEAMAPPETTESMDFDTIDDDVDIGSASNPNARQQKASPAERRHALETIVSQLFHSASYCTN